MGCGASKGVDVRPLSPVIPGGAASAPAGIAPPLLADTMPNATSSAPADGTPSTPADAGGGGGGGGGGGAFTDMAGVPSSPGSVPTPNTVLGNSLTSEDGSLCPQPTRSMTDDEPPAEAPTPQLEAPMPRARPKRPAGAPPKSADTTSAPFVGLVLELPEEQVGPPGATPGCHRKIPRPPPLEVPGGLTLELMSDEDEEDLSPVPPQIPFVKVGIEGSTPRDVREIDQSGDYRGIATPVWASGRSSPFYRADAFDESEESDGMSSCSEGENDLKPRTLQELHVRLSGSVAPAAPTWRWALDADPDQLQRCLAVCAPTHPLAATSPMVLISLTGCSLGPAAAEILGSVLLGAGNLPRTLHTLSLADNQLVGSDPAASHPVPDLDLTGLRALCGALKGASGLTALDLRRNVIGDTGLALLAGALWAGTPVVDVDVDGGEGGVRLQSLQLTENPLTGSALRAPPPADGPKDDS